MEPLLRIRRDDALTVTLSGLTPDEVASLQKLFLMSNRPDRPSFELRRPGAFSIHGSIHQLTHCLARLGQQPQVPIRVRAALASRLDNYLLSDYKIALRGKVLDLGSRTHVMGILNVTPDSFSDGGLYTDTARAVERAREMAVQGADIIDIGGESTRPGAEPLTEEEELRRIIPVIERLAAESTTPISVDTYKASVAKTALKAGASLVNDISGLRFSPDMANVVADHGAALAIMHIKGTPRNMQQNPVYADVVGEVLQYLEEGIEIALKAGVDRGKILIDPGIGFGKTPEHNLTLLNRLSEFRVLGRPILIGTSRKRFIGTVLDIPAPEQRIEGTAATVALAIERGAQMVRVHDVAQMVRVARMTDAIIRERIENRK
jgi:dihydropteroate synthase